MQETIPQIHNARPWLWAALTIVGLVVAFLAAFGIAATAGSVGLFPRPGDRDLRLDLALLLSLMAVLGMLSVLAAARVAFGHWPDVRPGHLLLPIIGVAVGIGVELALHEWAAASIGYYDWDFIGWTAGLSFSVVLVATAWFGLSVAPPGATAPPRIGLGLSAILVGLIVLSNVPELRESIGPNSWPLAILVGLSAVYAIGAAVTSLRRGSPG